MFKKPILMGLLAIFACVSFSQTNKTQKDIIVSANIQLDLNKYLGSHTGYQTRKKYKPILDFEGVDNYTGIGNDLSINIDGRFIAYNVYKGSLLKPDHLVVQSVTNDWRQEYIGVTSGFFSADGVQYIFRENDSLCFLRLGQTQLRVEKGVMAVKQTVDGKNKWVAWQLKGGTGTWVLENLLTGQQKYFDNVQTGNFEKSSRWFSCLLNNGELVIYNLASDIEHHFLSVADYRFDIQGQALVLKITNHSETGVGESLDYVELTDKKRSVRRLGTFNENTIKSFEIDGLGSQVVLVETNSTSNSVLYWRKGMDGNVMKIWCDSSVLGRGLQLQGASFSDNRNYLLLTMQKCPDTVKSGPDAISVDAWSYKDSLLQSAQTSMLKRIRNYQAILNLANGKVIYCEENFEYIKVKGDVGLVERNGRKNEKELGDHFWENNYDNASYRVISLKDGSLLKALKITPRGIGSVQFSPDGRFLIYFDIERGCNFFSIDLKTRKVVNISVDVPLGQLGYEDLYQRPRKNPIWPAEPPYVIAAWIKEEGAVLVYDSYDIWQLDLSGKNPAVNMTNGYGRRHHIILRLAGKNGEPIFLNDANQLLLKAFNRANKYNGYYKKALGAAGDPEMLYMGACFMTGQISSFGLNLMEPLKAPGANIWILKKETATEAPNYFLTTNFKSYKPVTDLQPQKQYNWYTTELCSFRQLDGTMTQGILYKPENFDSSKKYPLIINFYAQLSQNLYRYWRPNYIDAPQLFENPAWMVSHGYLVFLPDIYFTKNQYGPSTVNTIEGAAGYLRTLPFVDPKRIGVCGHSNGGRFGYYLFTHSNQFAAIALGSGFGGTDILSLALSLDYDNASSNLEWAERGALGTGVGNLWQNKATWLDHTAVLNVDKAGSPLLLFHNKRDGDDVRLAVELFNALRRLEKKVWWLQYDNGLHLVEGKDARDYTIRFTQYFDHYLKGAPSPRWMTQGIPAKLKGVDAKYELDPAGSCAMEGKTECAICKAWNEQNKRTPGMFSKPIAEWKLDDDLKKKLDKEEEQKAKANRVKDKEMEKYIISKVKGK